MSSILKLRREAAAFLATFIGAAGEALVDVTNNRLQVHDGVTPGGWPMARLADMPPKGNFNAAAAPTSSNDASQGYVAGSNWWNANASVLYICRVATVGAAIWDRISNSDHPGYAASTWYRTAPVGIGAGATLAAARPAYFPWIVKERVTIAAIEGVVSTAAASSNFQLAIYASSPTTRFPIGAPLYASPSLSGAATGTVNVAASLTLEPGLYWTSHMVDTASLVLNGFTQTAGFVLYSLGSTIEATAATTLANIYFVGAPVTFGVWPTLTGTAPGMAGASLNYCAAIHFQTAAVTP